MAGFHHPGDPYYPNQGNGERIENDPEEGMQEESDSDPENNNLPLTAPIQNPNPRPEFHGSTPLWATYLDRWSREQDQPLPFNGDRSFYNLSEGGSADRALPILVRRISRIGEQGRTTIHRTEENDANTGVNTVRIRQLGLAHGRIVNRNEALQRELTATQTEVIELRARQARHELRMLEMERQLAESKAHVASSRNK